MTIEVTFSSNSSYTIQDLFGAIDFIAFESSLSRFTTTFFGLTGTYDGVGASASVNGSGFAITTVGTDSFVTSGIIDTISFSSQGNILFENVNINLASFSQKIISAQTGSDTQAVERDLLARAWDITLGDGNDMASNQAVLPAGSIFNLTADDILRGGGGNDDLFTGNGDDMLYGDAGRDRLDGGRGDDMIFGGSGNDKIFGRNGRDVIDAGAGKDVVFGGNGKDVFVFGDKYGTTKIRDFDENRNGEDIDLSAVTAIKGFKDLKNNHMEQVNNRVVIDDGEGTRIILGATDVDDMNKGDFLF